MDDGALGTADHDHTPVTAQLTVSPDLTVLDASAELEPLLGVSAEAIVAQPGFLAANLHPKDRNLLADRIAAPLAESALLPERLRVRHADGRFRILAVTAAPARHADNSAIALSLADVADLPIEYSGVDSPIIATMMDTTNDFIFFKDANHLLLAASQSMVEICSPIDHWREFAGKSDYEVFPEHLADEYFALERRVYAGERVARQTQPIIYADGSPGWVDNRKFAIRNGDGKIIGLYGVARDITAEVRAADAMRLQAEVFERSGEGIVVIDPDGVLLSANPVFLSGAGLDADAAVGQHLRKVRHGTDGESRFDDRWERLTRDDHLLERIPITRTDGSDGVELMEFNAVRNDAGELLYYLGIYRDITELEQAHVQQARTDRLALLGQLSAGMAHELNNPLMGIINFAQHCLAETDPTHPLYPIFQRIEAEGNRCARLVSDLLAFARSEARAEQGGKAIDVEALVTRALALLDFKVQSAGVEVDLELLEGTFRVAPGEDELEQVLINLLSNAIDAMRGQPQRQLALRLRRAGDALILDVADTGTGIDPENRAHIFEPFYTTKPVGEGTGLGLAIARSVVERHGGELSVETAPGHGTTMRLTLAIHQG